MKFFISLLFGCASFLSIGSELSCIDKIHVITTNLPPLVTVQNNKPKGELTQKVTELLSPQVKAINIDVVNWARAINNAEHGSVDAIYPTLYNKRRAQYLDFSLPAIDTVTLSLYKNIENSTHSEHFPHSHHKVNITEKTKIATLRSLSLNGSGLSHAKITRVTNFEQAFKMLHFGRVDYVYGVQEITQHFIDNLQTKNIHVKNISIAKFIKKEPIYLALAKTSPNYQKLIQCLNTKKQ